MEYLLERNSKDVRDAKCNFQRGRVLITFNGVDTPMEALTLVKRSWPFASSREIKCTIAVYKKDLDT